MNGTSSSCACPSPVPPMIDLAHRRIAIINHQRLSAGRFEKCENLFLPGWRVDWYEPTFAQLGIIEADNEQVLGREVR